ncbi:MAG TPA: recombinase family protein, partial [Gemmataceae bacterium]|nr:recombinase family protein [Gemmataceae bacterium]
VSVTQQFNTATSMGRLVLNVLLSFAQFEREIIAERTRDKIAAVRRKGKWAGGHPVLGYDIDPRGFRLVVNDAEAARVRAIFDLYLEHQGLRAAVEELDRRGWRTKRWTTRKGHERGGRPFTKTSLHQLLTNVTYIGQVRYQQEIHAGEQPGIIKPRIWQRVQEVLRQHGRAAQALARHPGDAVLKGLLRCVACGCAMTPAHTTKQGRVRYRYYVCARAQKRGWHTCPSKALPAGAIERFVVEQLQAMGQDPTATEPESARAVAALVPAQGSLTPGEQARMVRLLVERVDYDGAAGTVAIRWQPSSLHALAWEPVAPHPEHPHESASDD